MPLDLSWGESDCPVPVPTFDIKPPTQAATLGDEITGDAEAVEAEYTDPASSYFA